MLGKNGHVVASIIVLGALSKGPSSMLLDTSSKKQAQSETRRQKHNSRHVDPRTTIKQQASSATQKLFNYDLQCRMDHNVQRA